MTRSHSFAEDQARWAAPLLVEFGHARDQVQREWERRVSENPSAGNAWLRDAHRILTAVPKYVRDVHTLDDMEQTARWLADSCTGFTADSELDRFRLRHRLCPVPGDQGGPRLKRAADWMFWRRQLRRDVTRFRDQIARHLGWVHKRRQIYCADAVVKWHRQRQAANLRTLEGMIAVAFDDNQGRELHCTLAEVWAAGLANPAIRRAELLARIRGFERWAEGHGDSATFVTLTCPSKYHARHADSGRPNRKWNGSTPREANAYLGKVWARARAELHRRGLRIYGFRIAEPHHDGCPHWHCLLFHHPDRQAELEEVLRRHGLAEDGHERGARKKRVTFARIDPAKGSATGYVIKYVAKAIDGHGVGQDLYGGEAEAASDRIVAWARTWKIRQFQQIGGPPVGVWREYRRIQPEKATSVIPPHHVPWLAASLEGRWDAFMAAMAAPDGYLAAGQCIPARNNRPRGYAAGAPFTVLRRHHQAAPGRNVISTLERRPAVDAETGEMRAYRSRYGDLVPASSRPIDGINRDQVILETRPLEWRIIHGAAQRETGWSSSTLARHNAGSSRGAWQHENPGDWQPRRLVLSVRRARLRPGVLRMLRGAAEPPALGLVKITVLKDQLTAVVRRLELKWRRKNEWKNPPDT